MKKALRTLLAALLLLEPLCLPLGASNFSIGYQGQLRQNGIPATGSHSVVFTVYPALTGGAAAWTSGAQNIAFSNGQFFSTFTPVNVDWEGSTPYLEISIDGTALSPREQLSAIPYAFNAQLHSGKKYTTNAAAPAGPTAGDLWYDTTATALKYYNGAAWVTPSGGGQQRRLAGGAVLGRRLGRQPLALLSSSVTLQGNAVNTANGLVRLNAAADLQVGAATASTISASGFVTMANLAGAPGAVRGRLYFDPAGQGR